MANRLNILQDIEIVLDEILGVQLHRGFQEDALTVYAVFFPVLDKPLPVRITGHSLGAAVAIVFAGNLEADGFAIACIITLGNPNTLPIVFPTSEKTYLPGLHMALTSCRWRRFEHLRISFSDKPVPQQCDHRRT